MLNCTSCGVEIAETASFCPNCGKPVGQAGVSFAAATATAPARETKTGLSDNLAGMLAYFTIIPAIIFLLILPYSRRRFVRFHAFQCLFLALACILASFAVQIIAVVPVIRWSVLLLWPLLGLAEVAIWLLCVLRSYQGQVFKLPVIGPLAEQQANRIGSDEMPRVF